MYRNDHSPDSSNDVERTEAWYFAQQLLGNPVSRPVATAEIDAHQAELRAFVRAITGVQEADWDPTKHPRGGYPQNRGMFSKTWGLRGNQKVKAGQQPDLTPLPAITVQGVSPSELPGDPSNPSRWYLPSENKGTWSGEKGNSTLRLKTPLEVDSKLLKEIEFKQGLPVLDKHVLPGKTVTIVLTGNSRADIANAKVAWTKLNPGQSLPRNSTFHHDLLYVAEETVEINGKKIKVLVGKMHLLPTRLHQLVFHEGSASVAYKYYRGLQIDSNVVAKFAKREALGVDQAEGFVSRASKRIVPGKIVEGISGFVGRNVIRLVPLLTSGLALVEFTENAEAHGIGGAAARAVPVLGDLISVHDLGSQWAKEIRDEANAAMDAVYRKNNAEVEKAWDDATRQTIEAFNELAPQVEVTNDPYNNTRLVDADEIAEALNNYRGRMQGANLLRQTKTGFDFESASSQAKEQLKQRLIKASQKRAPKRPGGPLA